MFMDFGRQVGSENPIRSDQIRSDQVKSGQSAARQGKTRQRQVNQAESVWSRHAAKAVDHFPPISPGKGGVHPTYKDVSSPGPKTLSVARRWRFLLRLFWQSRCSSFSHRFSMPFWVDLGSGFLLNLRAKIDQNPRKIDA